MIASVSVRRGGDGMVFESLVSRHTRAGDNNLDSLHKVACRRERRLDVHDSSNVGFVRQALTTADYT